jgi:hypothetical protein
VTFAIVVKNFRNKNPKFGPSETNDSDRQTDCQFGAGTVPIQVHKGLLDAENAGENRLRSPVPFIEILRNGLEKATFELFGVQSFGDRSRIPLKLFRSSHLF